MAKSGGKSNNKIAFRGIIAMLMILVLGFGTGIVRLVQLGVFMGDELQQKAVDQQMSDTRISAKRGTIYDANGKILAQSATVWKVVLAPINFESDEQRTIVSRGLAEILDLEQEDIYEKTKQASYYVEVKRRVETEVKDKILEFEQELSEEYNIKGVIDLLEDYKRYYPYGDFASSVIGFTGSDDQGLEGIELEYDSYLTGTPGRLITAKNAQGTEMPFKYEQKVDAENGNNLVLTIDETVQHVLEKYLQQGIQEFGIINRAVAIMMDVNTGAILGMAVEEGYDLNNPQKIHNKTVAEQIEALPEDEREAAETEAIFKQQRNKAIVDTYYPGSVFKIFTAAMGLEEHTITEESRYSCTGSYVPYEGAGAIGCHKDSGHGVQTFEEAICNSCNPAFMQIGQALGGEKFYEYCQKFGLTEKTGIDLPGESSGIFFPFQEDGTIHPMDLAVGSFGQNFSVTPLQMITGISAVANGGNLMQPYVVSQITDENGNVVESHEPVVKRNVISKEVSKKMCEVLEKNSIDGSGKNGYVAGYRVAGKTGTTEKKTTSYGSEDYISSYCGFAPADDPQVACLLYFDTPKNDANAYYGSMVAAPVCAEIMAEVLPYLNMETQYTEEEISKMDKAAENYVGMGTEEAANAAKAAGFEPVIKGEGTEVLSQIPAAESRLPQGGTVVLYTDSNSLEDDVVEVPDLVGMSVTDVNSIASSYGLNISISGASAASEGVSYAQSIEAGTKVNSGTVITVSFKQDSDYGSGVL